MKDFIDKQISNSVIKRISRAASSIYDGEFTLWFPLRIKVVNGSVKKVSQLPEEIKVEVVEKKY